MGSKMKITLRLTINTILIIRAYLTGHKLDEFNTIYEV